MHGTVSLMSGFFLALFISGSCLLVEGAEEAGGEIPPSWEVLPIPRYVDYGSTDGFVRLRRVAIVRRLGGPYQTVRDDRTELVGDSMLVTGWGPVEQGDGEGFRTTRVATCPIGRACLSCLDIKQPSGGRLLVRVKMGGGEADITKGTKVLLSTAGAVHEDAICRQRWVHWLLPAGAHIDQLTIEAEKPVRVYAVEVYRGSAGKNDLQGI